MEFKLEGDKGEVPLFLYGLAIEESLELGFFMEIQTAWAAVYVT